MATEAKRKFGNQELDVLDEIRFLLESQADLMDPAGDETITAARGFSSVKADILDRIRRATERQFKHAGSIFSGDATITGNAPHVISTIEKQVEVTDDASDDITVLSTTAPNVIRLFGFGFTQLYTNGKIRLSGCDVETDDGEFHIVQIEEHGLDTYTDITISEQITGGSTAGTATLYSLKNFPVVATTTGLTAGDRFSIVDSGANNGIYTFYSEVQFDDNGVTKYYIIASENFARETGLFGSIFSVEVLDNLSILNPFNSLFTTLHLWDSAGTDIYSNVGYSISKTAGQFVIPGASLLSIDLHIGDSIHYSIDSHV